MPWKQLRTLSLNSEEQDVKRRAIGMHISQTHPLSSERGDEVMLSDEFIAHFTGPSEVYVLEDDTESILRSSHSLSREYFEKFYADKSDPWGYETRWYEQRKRAITMAALPRERFTRALEVGCSIGVLTEQLASRCDSLIATDIAERPLRIAERRLAGEQNVTLLQLAADGEWPAGSFDLIVLSEVGYYLGLEDLDRVIRRAVASLSLEGVLLACHWRHAVSDYPLTGDQVHARLHETSSLERIVHHEEKDFVLELFSPHPARSVAEQTGLA